MHTFRLTHGLVVGWFVVFTLSACSGSTYGTGDGSQVAGGRGKGEDGRPGAGEAVTGEPRASRIELYIDPPRALYLPGETVRVTGWVLDQNGQDMPDAQLNWKVSPAGAATSETATEYTLVEEGRISFQACLAGASYCEDALVVVDAASPVLELTSPAAGAELGGDGATTIEVHGSIVDSGMEPLSVRVNGALVAVDELGAFSAQVTPAWGVNHIDVVGSDGLNEEVRIQRDVLWADAYLPWELDTARQTPSTAVDDAVQLRLGSDIFDDGQPLSTTRPLETRDLADLIELVLEHLDLKSALPDPLVDAAPALSLRVTAVKQGAVGTSIALVDGGAELFVRLDSVRIDTKGALDLEGTRLDLSGGIELALSALAVVHIGKASRDAPLSVTLESLNTNIESAEAHFRSEEANAIFRVADGTLRRSLERALEQGVGSMLSDALRSVLNDALSALDKNLRERSVLLDTEVLPPMNLEFDARIQSLETLNGLHLGTSLGVVIGSDQPLAHPTSRGTAGHAWGTMAALYESRPLQLGVRMDLLNALLHTLWNAGLFDVDALPLVPDDLKESITRVEVSGGLPPVLRKATASEGHDLWISIGQLEFALDVGTPGRYGISVEAGVDVSVVNNALVVQIAETPVLRIWLIESPPGQTPLDPEILRDVLSHLLWPALRKTMGEALSIQLPSLNADAIRKNAPKLAGFNLTLESARRVDVRGGALVFDLALLGRLP